MAQPAADRHTDIQERLAFETLLADLSSHFVNLPADRVDAEIKEAQRRICEALDLDVSSLWQGAVGSANLLTLTHLYRRLDGPEPPEQMRASESFPWTYQQIMAGKVVVVSSTEDVPAEAVRDRETWRHFGIKTSLGIPLAAGGGPTFGVLSFNDIQAERAWSDALVQRLQLVAQIFANALARKRADEALCESEARLRLAAASADAGLWELDLESRRLWVTDKTRTLFGLPPDGELTFEAFLTVVHPEDRERIQQAIEQATQSDEGVLVEFRSLQPDGRVRWIVSRGRRHPEAPAKPRRLLGVTIDITARKTAEEHLRATLAEMQQLRDQLQQQNRYLQEQVKRTSGYDAIVGESLLMQQVLARVRQVAPTETAILITGETGTGKELLAHALHDLSRRQPRPLVTVNCAALPPTLIESELFGREKGAYTGATTQQVGRFELAHGSTLFLDEVSDLPLDLQAKLLRVLETGQFERLGSPRTHGVNVRVVAAANRDLHAMVQAGTFRADLFYRLSVFPIDVPPLRDRREDIPLLVWQFIQHFAQKMGKPIESIPPDTMTRLQQYAWPGNVRELRNLIERAVILSDTRVLRVEFPSVPPPGPATPGSLEEAERRHICQVLERTGWRIRGKQGAAEQLGLRPTTLHSKLRRLGISRPPR
jgi:PAS domain S-box-containing protein